MNGGSLSRATRKPLTKPQKRADREARQQERRCDAACRRLTTMLPMTTKAKTMITPIDKVDAGGQDHQRLRGGEDADDGDLLQDERQRIGGEEALAAGDAEEDDQRHEHDQRHHGRVARAGSAGCRASADWLLLELGDRRSRCRPGPSRIPAMLRLIGSPPLPRRRAMRPARGLLRPAAAREKGGPCGRPARRAMLGSTSSQAGRDQPQHIVGAFLVSIDGDAVDRLVGDQRHAGVEEGLAFGRLRLLAVLGALRRSPRRRARPSAADTAARWRRSRRP